MKHANTEIAELAYEKWQLRGCPLWDDERDWFAAQSELEAEARVAMPEVRDRAYDG